ncbi:MAG TPA: diguanylate cyclase [Sulfuricurvum sp.]|nr:diguanylate cyclase [Sulfuricurvum sp.]
MSKVLLLFLLLFSPLFANPEIVTIHSYNEAYPWTKSQRTGFRTVINTISNIYPLSSTEYLDTKRRNFDLEYQDELLHYLSTKYNAYVPNVIYVTDDDALNFMIQNRGKLFPSVPVVFSGINDLSKKESLDPALYTGIFEKKEILPNLKLIKTLYPDETEVLVISDGSLTAQLTRKEIEKETIAYKDMKIKFASDQNFDRILSGLKKYQGKAIILTTIGGFKGQNGDLLSINEVTNRIVRAGAFVVLTLEDTYIQEGVLGGYCVDGHAQGEEAGKLALQILLHPKLPLSHVEINTNHWIFDAKALSEKGIVLPRAIEFKSQFLNPPKTFFQLYQQQIINLVYLLFSILLIVSILFSRYLYRSRRVIKQRENSLLKVSSSLNKAQAIAHLGNWEWNIETNDLWWSDEIYRIFGLLPQEFKATYHGFLERVHPDDREMVENAVMDALTNNAEYRVEHRILRVDGTLIYVLEEGQIETDGSGEPIKMSGIVYDITEQKNGHMILEASENKYRNLVENAMIGIYHTDLFGHILYVNQALADMLGYDSPAQLMGQDSTVMYNDPEIQKKIIHILQKKNHISNFELKVLDKYSAEVPVMMSATLEGDIISGIILDMRELKKSRDEIDKLSKAIAQIDDTVTITDISGIITYVNESFVRHTGYSKKEALGQTLRILKSGNHDNAFYENLWKTLLSGKTFRGTIINRKKNGDLYYEDKTATPLKDDNETIVGFITTGKDVTHETLLNDEIKRIAMIDNLTGIYNRHKFEELFTLEAERARRFSLPLSLLLIDIDHFKSVNDTYGHDTGDEVLKQLVSIVQAHIRKLDVFARWGGEEFLVLCPSTDLENIHVLANKLRLEVESSEFPKVANLTISIGISTFVKTDSFSDLFKRADQGLYLAKEGGRNQVRTIE